MRTTSQPSSGLAPTCDLKTYRSLARQANWVPVWATVPADLLTPVSAFWKLTHQAGSRKQREEDSYSFLFESVEGGESIARFTFLGTGSLRKGGASSFPLMMKYWLPEPLGKVASAGGNGPCEKVEVWEQGRRSEYQSDFVSLARERFRKFVPARVEGLPPLTAGAVGYMNYDAISRHEPVKLPRTADKTPMPDAILMLFSTLLIFDHVKHQIWIVHNTLIPSGASGDDVDLLYEAAAREVTRVMEALESPEHPPTSSLRFDVGSRTRQLRLARLALKSNITKPRFLTAVKKAKEYIKAGDIFQVVLSQRLQAKVRSSPFEIYRALRRVNPAPYLFFLRMGSDSVLGSSPEMLVKVTDGAIEYRPIAGTRKRGATPEQDEALERELLADEKELAEHTMLVDLGRNDVGRVASYGTVRVAKLKFIERYSHVMHLVSSIEGRLRPGLDAWDALLACFPAGTVTGAPKVRAMQIISELEPTRRGVYAGTVFYYDLSGNLNSCIAIRSIVLRGGQATVQVGAGIVADSVPELEFEETMNKGRAMLAAISIAEQQFAGRSSSATQLRRKQFSRR